MLFINNAGSSTENDNANMVVQEAEERLENDNANVAVQEAEEHLSGTSFATIFIDYCY